MSYVGPRRQISHTTSSLAQRQIVATLFVALHARLDLARMEILHITGHKVVLEVLICRSCKTPHFSSRRFNSQASQIPQAALIGHGRRERQNQRVATQSLTFHSASRSRCVLSAGDKQAVLRIEAFKVTTPAGALKCSQLCSLKYG